MSIPRRALAAAQFFGAGVRPGTTIEEVASFFLFSDDFDRPDAAAVGNGWVEELETCRILSNLLRLEDGGGGAAFCHRPNAEATSPNLWVQAVYTHNTNTVPAIVGLFNTDAFAGRDGYQVRADSFGADLFLERVTGGALTVIDTVGVANGTNIFYIWQFALTAAPDVQEVNWFRQSAPLTIRALSGADATHAALAKRVSCQRGAGTTETADFDDVLICRGAADPMHITCSGMRAGSGDKIRIFADMAGTVLVAEAAEVAGVATIDIFNVASGLEWPLAGHPRIDLTSAADVSFSSIQGGAFADGGVYPGGTFQAV